MALSSLETVIAAGMQNQGISRDDALNAVKNQTNVSTILDQGTAQLNSIKSQASKAVNSSLSSLTSGLSSFSSLFTSNALTGILTTSKVDAAKGPKEADSKIKSLASDASSALANPVAFISKPVNDAIKGIDTLSQGTGLKDYLTSMNSTEISNLAKSTGNSITSSSDVLDAVVNSTNSLASSLKSIPDSLSAMTKKITAPITSSLNSFSSTIKSGISSSLLSSLQTTTTNSLISSGSNLTNAVIGLLPNSLTKYIQKSTTSYLESTMNSLVGDKLTSYNHILSLLSGNFSSDTLLEKLLNLGDSSKYPKTLSTSTNSSSTSSDITTAVYNAAKTICTNVSTPASTSFQLNKDLYDLLMDIAAEYGLSDLIKQLSNCTTVADTLSTSTLSTLSTRETTVPQEYMDERTVTVLQNKTRDIAMKGDSETYKTIQEVITASQVKEAHLDMVVLAANMSDEQFNLDNFDTILQKNNLTKDDLIYLDNIGEEQIIDGVTASAMCASNTTIVDGVLTPEVRVLTQSAMYAYA